MNQTVALRTRARIGRDPNCEFPVDDPHVSREHCVVELEQGSWVLRDTSLNGTYLNGQRLKGPHKLKNGDEILVGLSRFVFTEGQLTHFAANRVRLDIVELQQQPSSTATLQRALGWAMGKTSSREPARLLLNDISFLIKPQELVAIIGGSGAGKSTLLKALTGFRPASAGHVYLNGVDLYANYESLKAAIGYVPQDDIVPSSLPVETVLRYAAWLRLPDSADEDLVGERVDEVLRRLSIDHRRYNLVSTLSGGERKRLNVAVELLARPGLLFLDEPTTGLSPDFEVEFMRQMRQLTESGQTVVMVSHSERCIAACDRVVLVAQGGRLSFTGTPQEALAYFAAKDFSEVLRRINTERSAQQWEKDFADSPLRHKYQPRRFNAANVGDLESRTQKVQTVLAQLNATSGQAGAARQWWTFTRRYWDTMLADLPDLAVRVLTPVIIGLILCAVPGFNHKLFEAQHAGHLFGIGSLAKATVLLAFLVIVSSFLGVSNAARELTKERPLYERERAAGLQLLSYLGSKAVVLSLLCAVQILLLMAVISLKIPLAPGRPPSALVALHGILTLTAISAMGLGLLVSSLARTNEQAANAIPLILLPLIAFSGFVAAPQPGTNFHKLSQSALSYFSSGSLTEMQNIGTVIRQIKPSKGVGGSFNLPKIVSVAPLDGATKLVAFAFCYFVMAVTVLWARERLSAFEAHCLRQAGPVPPDSRL